MHGDHGRTVPRRLGMRHRQRFGGTATVAVCGFVSICAAAFCGQAEAHGLSLGEAGVTAGSGSSGRTPVSPRAQRASRSRRPHAVLPGSFKVIGRGGWGLTCHGASAAAVRGSGGRAAP